MAKTIVETVYGKYSKYEVVKDSGLLSTSFYVCKDGKYVSSYDSLKDAVEAAKKKAAG